MMNKTAHSKVSRIACMIAISLLPFLILKDVTHFFLQDVYLFQWMHANGYCYLWVIVTGACLLQSKFAYVLAYSNEAAILLGQVIGDAVKAYHITQITPDMSAQQEAMMREHKGVFIWLLLLLLTIVVYLFDRFLHKRRHKTGFERQRGEQEANDSPPFWDL